MFLHAFCRCPAKLAECGLDATYLGFSRGQKGLF